MSERILGISVILLSLVHNQLPGQNYSQYTEIDQIMSEIPDSLTYATQDIAAYINDNFSTQEDKSRAIFIWIAGNIVYDVGNIYAFDIHYMDIYRSSDQILKNRKGICGDYTTLFFDLAKKTGLKTYVITGYTKKNKRVNHIPHSWCVVEIEDTWCFFDPTWGAGYVDNNQFVKKVNNSFFKVAPEDFVKTHIPFDPLWQFIHYPITKSEFKKDKTRINQKKEFFNYIDTLSTYEKLSEIEQLKSSMHRIAFNEITNYMTYDKLIHMRMDIENYVVNQYNLAVKYSERAGALLNRFIEYSNNYFEPFSSEKEIRMMLNEVEESINLSFDQLQSIIDPTPDVQQHMITLNNSLNSIVSSLNENRENLEEHLKIAEKHRNSLSSEMKY